MKLATEFAFGAPRAACPALTLSLALGLAHGMLTPGAVAATVPTKGFLACAAEQDDASRLACFDAAVAHAKTQPAATAVAAAPAVAVVPLLSKEEKFGLRGGLKQEKAKAVSELSELDELSATVTSVAAKPYGQLVLTLDNGQVWYEIQANSGIRVRTGDRVIIKSGALGSYSIVAPNGRSSKVTRAR